MLPVFHSTYIDECCIKPQWEVRMSNSKGLPYFFNKDTKESFWDAPSDLSEEQVKALPGAEYLTGASKGRAGQVRASHLLVKHQGSRRPSSWKEVSCQYLHPFFHTQTEQENITRTKEEAIEILRGYQAQINGSAATFSELASEHSDCSSHANGGDLGWFGRGQMQKPFEDAAYGLEIGKISDVISSDSGVHLVLRTG